MIIKDKKYDYKSIATKDECFGKLIFNFFHQMDH